MQRQVRPLLLKHESVLSAFEGDFGCTNLISHDIALLISVRLRYHCISPSNYDVVKAHTHQLQETQIIRASSIQYAFPIVLVRNKDSSLHLCADYRQLNRKTKKDASPLPWKEESLAQGQAVEAPSTKKFSTWATLSQRKAFPLTQVRSLQLPTGLTPLTSLNSDPF